MLCMGALSGLFGAALPCLLRCRQKRVVWAAALGFGAVVMLLMSACGPSSQTLAFALLVGLGVALGGACSAPSVPIGAHWCPSVPIGPLQRSCLDAAVVPVVPNARHNSSQLVTTRMRGALCFVDARAHRCVVRVPRLCALPVAARESIPWSVVTAVSKGSGAAGARTAVFNLSQALPALVGSLLGSLVLRIATLSAVFGLCSVPMLMAALAVLFCLPVDLAQAEHEASSAEIKANPRRQVAVAGGAL